MVNDELMNHIVSSDSFDLYKLSYQKINIPATLLSLMEFPEKMSVVEKSSSLKVKLLTLCLSSILSLS